MPRCVLTSTLALLAASGCKIGPGLAFLAEERAGFYRVEARARLAR